MSTQIATSDNSAATATPAGAGIAVAPSDAALNVLYFDGANGGPRLATAVSPYTTWNTQGIGAATSRNSQAVAAHGGDDNLDIIVTSPANGPYRFTGTRSGNVWNLSAIGATGDANEAGTTGTAAAMWAGIDPQGRLWYVGLDDVLATYSSAAGDLSGGTWTIDATLEAIGLGEQNHSGIAAAIIGNYLVVVYDSGSGGLKYLRRDVSGVSLGAWSAASAVGGVSGIGTGSTLSLRAIPGGSTGMLAYSGSNGISALKYDAGADAWGAVSVLSSAANDRHPVLVPGPSGSICALWCQYAAANSYALVACTFNGSAWASQTATLEASGSNIAWPNASYIGASGKIAYTWTQGTAAPYGVQFNTAPWPVLLSDTGAGRDRSKQNTAAIATSSSTNGFLLYPSNLNQVAYLPDGSLLFVLNTAPTLTLYRIANPGATVPSATSVQTFTVTGATAASTLQGDLHVQANSDGSADVWVAWGENNNVGGSGLRHAVYSAAGVWTWDAAVSLVFNSNTAASVDMATVTWTGTYLIVLRRAQVGGSTGVWMNYTTDKTGATGWQANLIQFSSIIGGSSHYFSTLLHDSALGCTVAIYSINGDTLQSRVLPDSSSPALANWGAETALGTGTGSFDNFQGAACNLDHASGRVHVAYTSASGTMDAPGYVSGTITVNGASSAVSWGTPIAVGVQAQGFNASMAIAIDGAGTVFVFWNNHYPSNTASDVFYAMIPAPYTAALPQVQYTSGGDHVQMQVPKRERCTFGYIPLFYWTGAGTPYTIIYDTSIIAAIAPSDSAVGSESVITGQPVSDSATGSDAVSVNTGGGTTPVSVSDSASGSDAVSVQAAVPASDAGSGSDSASVQAAAPVSDAGSGTDTPTIQAAIPVSDAGSGSDAASVAASAAIADTAAGGEGVGIVAGIPVGDAGSGADSIGTTAAIPVGDAGTGADGAATLASIPVGDTGAGHETADAGTGGIAVGVSDPAAAAEAVYITVAPIFFGASITASTGTPSPSISATERDGEAIITGTVRA